MPALSLTRQISTTVNYRLAFVIALLSLVACDSGSSSRPISQASDDIAVLAEDSSILLDIASNDLNVDASSLSITEQPDNGTAVVNDGQLLYTPDADFAGTDSLGYSVESNNNTGTNSATVSFTITSVNDQPVAVGDSAITFVNQASLLPILANDTDVDNQLTATGITITVDPMHGQLTINSANESVIYQPDTGYVGADSFTYRITDDAAAASQEVLVRLSVLPLDHTGLVLSQQAIPRSGYSTMFNNELGKDVLVSPLLPLVVPDNVISLALYITGDDVFTGDNEIYIHDLIDPMGISHAAGSSIYQTVAYCDPGYCNLLVPRRPDILPLPGTWLYQLGLAGSNSNFDGADANMTLAIRLGPSVPTTWPRVTLAFNTIVTGSLVEAADIALFQERATEILLSNGIDAEFDTPNQLPTAEFAEVSFDVTMGATAELIRTYNDPERINLYILDSFSGPGGDGLLGITGGIPGTMGKATKFNGILLNGTATKFDVQEFYLRSTAEVLVHEVGHYLGLHHTTEADFSGSDLISDTPTCLEDTHDANQNRLAEQIECPDGPNIMFWQNLFFGDKEGFSNDQLEVLARTPIGVIPGE